MALNGISTATSSTPTLTKILRRDLKLAEAQAKRRSVTTSSWYRALNSLGGTHQAYINGIGGASLETLSGTASPTQGHPWSTAFYGVEFRSFIPDGSGGYMPGPVITSCNEGEVIWFDIYGTNTADDPTAYLQFSGMNITNQDVSTFGPFNVLDPIPFNFGGGDLPPPPVVGSPLLINADNIAEGNETLTLSWIVNSSTVATANITLYDTTYSLTADRSVMNEGTTATFTLLTTRVADGTELYWNNASDNLADSRLTPSSGVVTVNSGTASFTVTVSADNADQTGIQTLRLNLYDLPDYTDFITTSSPAITVADTSQFTYFEQQLSGGTYMTFDQTISGYNVHAIVTNFNGNPTHGSYLRINGTVVASDWTVAPDGTDNTQGGGVGYRMTRGHTAVALDPVSGTVRAGWPKRYDTYGTPSLCTTMAADLASVASGDLVIFGTYDATSCTQDLRDALTNYFGDTGYTNTWVQQRTSHMFLGRRL